jgi:hypothetical protein
MSKPLPFKPIPEKERKFNLIATFLDKYFEASKFQSSSISDLFSKIKSDIIYNLISIDNRDDWFYFEVAPKYDRLLLLKEIIEKYFDKTLKFLLKNHTLLNLIDIMETQTLNFSSYIRSERTRFPDKRVGHSRTQVSTTQVSNAPISKAKASKNTKS